MTDEERGTGCAPDASAREKAYADFVRHLRAVAARLTELGGRAGRLIASAGAARWAVDDGDGGARHDGAARRRPRPARRAMA